MPQRQPRTAPLGVRRRRRVAGQPVQLGQRRTGKGVLSLVPGWGEIGQVLRAGLQAQHRGQHRIQVSQRGHIDVGEITDCPFGRLGHKPILASITGGAEGHLRRANRIGAKRSPAASGTTRHLAGDATPGLIDMCAVRPGVVHAATPSSILDVLPSTACARSKAVRGGFSPFAQARIPATPWPRAAGAPVPARPRAPGRAASAPAARLPPSLAPWSAGPAPGDPGRSGSAGRARLLLASHLNHAVTASRGGSRRQAVRELSPDDPSALRSPR